MPKGNKRPSRLPSAWFPDHSDAIAKMSTKSVLSPLLWGAGVLVSLLLVAAIFIDGSSRDLLIWLVASVVIFVLISYGYFAIVDPDRLQSEDYIVARQHIALLRESGKAPTTIDLAAEQIPNAAVENAEVGKIDER